jgi:hypothetical protein
MQFADTSFARMMLTIISVCQWQKLRVYPDGKLPPACYTPLNERVR